MLLHYMNSLSTRLIFVILIVFLVSEPGRAAIETQRKLANIAFSFVNNTGLSSFINWQTEMPEQLHSAFIKEFHFQRKKLKASENLEVYIINRDRFGLRDICIEKNLDFIIGGFVETRKTHLFIYSRFQNRLLIEQSYSSSQSQAVIVRDFLSKSSPALNALSLKNEAASSGIENRPVIYREKSVLVSSHKNRFSVFLLLPFDTTQTISPTLAKDAGTIDTMKAPMVRGVSVQYSRVGLIRYLSPFIGLDYAVPIGRVKDNNDTLVPEFYSARIGAQGYYPIDKNFFLSAGFGGSHIFSGRNSYINSSGKNSGYVTSKVSYFSGWSGYLLFSAGAKPWPAVSFDAGLRLEYKSISVETTTGFSGNSTSGPEKETIGIFVPTMYFGTSLYL